MEVSSLILTDSKDSLALIRAMSSRFLIGVGIEDVLMLLWSLTMGDGKRYLLLGFSFRELLGITKCDS